MVFITRLLINNKTKPNSVVVRHKLNKQIIQTTKPIISNQYLVAWHQFWQCITQRFMMKNVAWLIGIFCLFFIPVMSWAESVVPIKSEAVITGNGQLSISSRFKTDLPEQLADALRRGVPLDFTLSYQLEKPTLASYKHKLNQLINSDNSVSYRLSYHPLTNRYRVSVGTFSSEYNSLTVALKGVGAIAGWHVLDRNTLNDTKPNEVKAYIRLSLSIANLPKPFQINALTSNSWQLDSGWKPLNIGN